MSSNEENASLSHRGQPAKVEPDDILVRRGVRWETVTRLAKMAQEAAAVGLPHGVSVTTPEANQRLSLDPTDAMQTTRKAFEDAGFTVWSTPTRNDAWHHTVELPSPVTDEIALRFNELLGRVRK